MTLPQIPKQTPSLRRIPQTVAPRAIASLTPEEYAQLSDYDTHLLNVACGIRTAHQFIDTHIIPRAQTPPGPQAPHSPVRTRLRRRRTPHLRPLTPPQKQKKETMTHIRLITLFSGYDSQALAFERLCRLHPGALTYDLVAWCEIDPDAIKAHDAIFPQYAGRNVGDICKVDPSSLPDCDLITYSFPCQDISNAGKQAGFSKGSGSRSSLLWECEKIFRAKRPRFLLLENVKALIQKKFMPFFNEWLATLDTLGYDTYWKVLNAKDFGVAQNRERVFALSILRDPSAPAYSAYSFPEGFPLTKCVEDYMEPAETIDESYFISQDRVTDKILADMLTQPNVRAELEKLYHEEWKERLANPN